MTVFREPDDAAVARIEMVTPGDRRNPAAVDRFVSGVVDSADGQFALLVVDPFPSEPASPGGLTAWLGRHDGGTLRSVGRAITVATRPYGPEARWSIAHVRLGDVLPDVPLDLGGGVTLTVPLQSSYTRAYAGTPRHLRTILDRSI